MSTEGEEGIGFADFIISLARTAAVHFGDIEDPGLGEKQEPNLPAAFQMIELIAMLQEKTRGNLTPTESQLVDHLLYDLRMRYVEAQQSGGRRIIEP